MNAKHLQSVTNEIMSLFPPKINGVEHRHYNSKVDEIITTLRKDLMSEVVEKLEGLKFSPRIGRDKDGKIIDYTPPIEEGHNQALTEALTIIKSVTPSHQVGCTVKQDRLSR